MAGVFMQKSFLVLFTLFISFILFINCEDSSTEPQSGSNILVINHFGVDWSKGKSSTETDFVDEPDGETIAWCPSVVGSTSVVGIWYRSAKNHIYKWGRGDISEVLEVDTTKWDPDICDSPLRNGDIWITEALDGYVAFKVLDAPSDSVSIANSYLWSVEVEYVFSNSLIF
jgi:hypothetical protein